MFYEDVTWTRLCNNNNHITFMQVCIYGLFLTHRYEMCERYLLALLSVFLCVCVWPASGCWTYDNFDQIWSLLAEIHSPFKHHVPLIWDGKTEQLALCVRYVVCWGCLQRKVPCRYMMVYLAFSLDSVHCSTKLSIWAGAALCFSKLRLCWSVITVGNRSTIDMYVIWPHFKKPELSL